MKTLKGYKDRDIEIRTDLNGNDRIAFFYPGLRYGSDAPLFYYLTRLLRSQNVDICFFEFEWNKLSLPTKEETIEVIKLEIEASIDFIKSQDVYKTKYLFSKSVGTLITECISEDFLKKFEKQFYFTPFVDIDKCINENSFIYYSGNDKYTEEKYKTESYAPGCRFYSELDHSMVFDGNIQKSIKAMSDIVKDVENDL